MSGGGSENPMWPAAIFITSGKTRRTEVSTALPQDAEEKDTEEMLPFSEDDPVSGDVMNGDSDGLLREFL